MSNFELTYATMFDPPEELHTRFEEAMEAARANLGQEYGMIIAGEERYAEKKFKRINPANTDEVLGVFQSGSPQDADDAITAAKEAFPAWSRTPWEERVELLRTACDLINERIFDISAATTLEVGKNRMEALGDVSEAGALTRYACDQMEKNDGFIVKMGEDPLVGYTATNYSVLRPYGAWLVISPFNFPSALSGGPTGAASWLAIQSC